MEKKHQLVRLRKQRDDKPLDVGVVFPLSQSQKDIFWWYPTYIYISTFIYIHTYIYIHPKNAFIYLLMHSCVMIAWSIYVCIYSCFIYGSFVSSTEIMWIIPVIAMATMATPTIEQCSKASVVPQHTGWLRTDFPVHRLWQSPCFLHSQSTTVQLSTNDA